MDTKNSMTAVSGSTITPILSHSAGLAEVGSQAMAL